MRLRISMVPYHGDALAGKRTLVAAAHGIVPRLVVGVQAEAVFGYVPAQPFSVFRMAGGEEINKVRRVVGTVVSSHHVEVKIALHLAHAAEVLHEIPRPEQSVLLAVPEGEDDRTLRLGSALHESPHDLQHGAHTRRVVVGTIIYIVAGKLRIHALMVEMGTHHYVFVAFPSGYHAEHIGEGEAAMLPALYLRHGVCLHIIARHAVEHRLGTGFEGLQVAAVRQRRNSQLAHLRNDVQAGKPRASMPCLPSSRSSARKYTCARAASSVMERRPFCTTPLGCFPTL